MRHRLLLTALIFTLAAAGGITSGCPVGGGCQYKDYKGVVTIEAISRQSNENPESENPDERLFIFYTFKADVETPLPVNAFSEDQLYTRREIENRKMKPGTQFRAKARYIERGSCNPGPYLEKLENWQ